MMYDVACYVLAVAKEHISAALIDKNDRQGLTN